MFTQTNNCHSDEPILFFYPLGNKREKAQLNRTTNVNIKFDLHLQALHFQKKYSKDEPRIERNGIVPNPDVIRQLTDTISDNNFYIKRVIENPQRTSKASAHILHYFWDVAGRFYQGLFPVDFHIVVTGEENYLKPSQSIIQLDINLQGIAYNEEIQRQIEGVGERLVGIIEDVLDNLPTISSQETLFEEKSHFTNKEEWKEPFESSQTPTNDRITDLRSRIETLNNAWSITEKLYTEMRERYEQELQEMEKRVKEG